MERVPVDLDDGLPEPYRPRRKVAMADEKANLDLAAMLAREVLVQLHQERVPEDVLDLLAKGGPSG